MPNKIEQPALRLAKSPLKTRINLPIDTYLTDLFGGNLASQRFLALVGQRGAQRFSEGMSLFLLALASSAKKFLPTKSPADSGGRSWPETASKVRITTSREQPIKITENRA